MRQALGHSLRVGPLTFILLITGTSSFAQITPIQPGNSVDWNQASHEFVSTRELAGSSPRFDLVDSPPGNDTEAATGQEQQHGFIVRNLRRGLADQKSLYAAPFKVKNLKWDILFLGVTGGLLAGDRQASRQISNDHVDLSHAVALGTLLGTSAAAGGIWAYGLKTGDRHANETGELTLETLANTFLIYTPMQFIAGRERPDDGTGNGRFWVHRSFNTSFPAGHPMFTWAMASVIAHEYPRTWVKILAYGAAGTLTVSRFTGRNHFMSDLWVGSALGYLIGAKIFHDRCDPQFSEACRR